MTDDLVPWLRAQLDADQKSASQWHDLECDIHDHLDGDIHKAIAASRMLTEVPGAVCDCGGPARVLREVEAKRAIVEALAEADPHAGYITGAYRAEDALRDLAAVYADRDGYKEEWKL